MSIRPESSAQNVVTKVDLEHNYAPSSFARSPLYGWTCLHYSVWDYRQPPWDDRTTRALWQIDNALLGWRLQEVWAREPWSSLELPSCFHPYPDGCWSVSPDHDRRLAARTRCARTRVRRPTQWSWGSKVGLCFEAKVKSIKLFWIILIQNIVDYLPYKQNSFRNRFSKQLLKERLKQWLQSITFGFILC